MAGSVNKNSFSQRHKCESLGAASPSSVEMFSLALASEQRNELLDRISRREAKTSSFPISHQLV